MHFDLHRKEKNKHKCKICHLHFTNENEIPYHTELHSKFPSEQCVICMERFKSLKYVRMHMLAQVKASLRHTNSKMRSKIKIICFVASRRH